MQICSKLHKHRFASNFRTNTLFSLNRFDFKTSIFVHRKWHISRLRRPVKLKFSDFWFFNMCYFIGGFRGAHPARAPPRDPILSFWHTNFTKCSCLGSPRPPYEVHTPPTGNPGSATVLVYSYTLQKAKFKVGERALFLR